MSAEHAESFEFDPKEKPKDHWKSFTVGVMSASSDSNEPAKENARAIGELLAKSGFDARNGGYSAGAMRELADGFREKCLEIGIEEDEIKKHLSGIIFSENAVGSELAAKRGVNHTATISEADNLSARAGGIINESNAIVVMEGGLGTILEGLLSAQGEWVNMLRSDHKPKPIIIIDSKQMLPDIVELAEGRSPGTIETITNHIFVLSGHSNPKKAFSDQGLDVATVKNDEHIKAQLEGLLEYYYLLNQEELSEEQDQQKTQLEADLFNDDGKYRVLTLKERLKKKSEFNNGGGI